MIFVFFICPFPFRKSKGTVSLQPASLLRQILEEHTKQQQQKVLAGLTRLDSTLLKMETGDCRKEIAFASPAGELSLEVLWSPPAPHSKRRKRPASPCPRVTAPGANHGGEGRAWSLTPRSPAIQDGRRAMEPFFTRFTRKCQLAAASALPEPLFIWSKGTQPRTLPEHFPLVHFTSDALCSEHLLDGVFGNCMIPMCS